MDEQLTVEIDAVLRERRGIRHERRRDPDDPFLRLGLAHEPRERGEQQPQLADAVVIETDLDQRSARPASARQVWIELRETARHGGLNEVGTAAAPDAHAPQKLLEAHDGAPAFGTRL